MSHPDFMWQTYGPHAEPWKPKSLNHPSSTQTQAEGISIAHRWRIETKPSGILYTVFILYSAMRCSMLSALFSLYHFPSPDPHLANSLFFSFCSLLGRFPSSTLSFSLFIFQVVFLPFSLAVTPGNCRGHSTMQHRTLVKPGGSQYCPTLSFNPLAPYTPSSESKFYSSHVS